MNMIKIIKLKDETHAKLNKIGERGESFNDIVSRLIQFYEEKTKPKK